MARELDADIINVNLVLAAKLLELTARQRTLQLSKLLHKTVENARPIALLDNTEILFDNNLRQDPLRLFQSVSRHRRVVASWNGQITGNKLTYAEVGHPEYRSHDLAETLVVDVNELTRSSSVGQMGPA